MLELELLLALRCELGLRLHSAKFHCGENGYILKFILVEFCSDGCTVHGFPRFELTVN